MKQFFTFLALLLAGNTSYPAAQETLSTIQVNLQATPKEYRFNGVVEAVNQSTISAQTQGQIEVIFFDVDDYVEKDALIIQLKDTQQRAQLAQAEAELKAAEAALKNARSEYTRIKGIHDKKLVSQSTMDQANTTLKQATAKREATLAGLHQTREQLEYTQVRAPYSGILTKRFVEVGEIATPGQPLISGISLDQLRVNVDIPQSLVNTIRKQGKGYVQQPGNGFIEAARVTIFPYAQSSSNTFKVRLDLPAGSKNMFPGMYVKTRFHVGEERHLTIPAEAVVYRSEVTGVYTVDDNGKVSLRHIRTGDKTLDGQIIVLSGLEAGERIALDPIVAARELKRQHSGGPDE